MPSLERGLQPPLSLEKFLQECTGLILPTTSAHCRSHQARQGRRMEWSLQERYIPKSASKRRTSVVVGPAALRQEDDRKVRPGRLPQQERRQRLQVGATAR